jgi:hypothetical protein
MVDSYEIKNVSLSNFFLSFFLSCTSTAQTNELKSWQHGLDMMLRDVPKESLIEEMRFEYGKNATINVVRLDHVGPSLYPLLISSQLAVPTDSLGLLSFKLPKDSLYNFIEMIDNVTPKVYDRNRDEVLIRVTYRFEGRVAQYYVTNARIATGFLKMIEGKLIAFKEPEALDKFYRFIAEMRLQIAIHGKRTWKY